MKEIVSQKIKNARVLKGFSQQELANKVGISKQMISKYEKGESFPSSTVLLKFKNQLNVSMNYFFKPNKIELGVINFRKKSSFSQKKQDSLEQLIKLKPESQTSMEKM